MFRNAIVRGVCLLAIIALIAATAATVGVWVDGPTHVPAGLTAMSSQDMVCSGDIKVWLSSNYDNTAGSGAVTHVSPWHFVTANWGAHCEPVESRFAEIEVACMATKLLESGCGQQSGCVLVDMYKNAEWVGTEFDWKELGFSQ